MKILFTKPVLLLLLISTIGCKQESNRANDAGQDIPDDETHYHEQELAEGDIWEEVEINNFMLEAAEIDKMQIRAANIAKARARHNAVKDYAETLKTDHSNSLENLKKIIAESGLALSDSIDADHQKKLTDLENNDTDFDRSFLEMMVLAHKKDIAKYQNAMKNITHHHPVKDWIDEVLPVMQQHLHRAETLLADKSIFPTEE